MERRFGSETPQYVVLRPAEIDARNADVLQSHLLAHLHARKGSIRILLFLTRA